MILKKGSKGTDVKELQRALKELGYNVGVADGDFGSATQRPFRIGYCVAGGALSCIQTRYSGSSIMPVSSFFSQ